MIVRLINKALTISPSLPDSIPKWQVLMASATHFGLYVSMLMMPLSGLLMQSADGRVVNVFGLITLPQLVEPDIELYAIFREIHGALTLLFLVMIFI